MSDSHLNVLQAASGGTAVATITYTDSTSTVVQASKTVNIDASGNPLSSLSFASLYGEVTAVGGSVFAASAYNSVYTIAASGTSPVTTGWENVLAGSNISILLTNTQACTLSVYASIDSNGTYQQPVVVFTLAQNQGLEVSFPANGNYYQYVVTNTSGSSGTFNLNVYYGSIGSSGPLPLSLAQTVTQAMPTGLQNGKVGVSATAASLGLGILGVGVVVRASGANTASIFVGNSSVSTTTGYELSPGEAVSLTVSNLSQVYVIAAAAQSCTYIGS